MFRKKVLLAAIAALVLFAPAAQAVNVRPFHDVTWVERGGYGSFLRTELYFGTDMKDGAKVTEDDWDKFLASEVTPRFPDGFTVLHGFGQFRGADGKIVREESRILLILYPLKNRRTANRKIEQIRNSYKTLFRQESVMRLDFTQPVKVSF